MQKPEWVSTLTNARLDESYTPHMIAWRVVWVSIFECGEVDLGQFKDGVWFSGTCAGDTACDVLERNYKQHVKGAFDGIDEAIRKGGAVSIETQTPDMQRLLIWYVEAKRAELNRNT